MEAYRIKVLAGVPAGILFKSASTRGGTIENIDLHDFELEEVPTAISVTCNWNPSYSYTKLPDGSTNVPDYWRVLLEPVPPAKGLPHFRNVRISRVRAFGAQRAFAVSSYREAPLRDFQFDDLVIEAKTAGSIQNAENWTLRNTAIRTADGAAVSPSRTRPELQDPTARGSGRLCGVLIRGA